MLADSGMEAVALADVAALSSCQRWVARNEIFARNGRFFVTPILKEHFGAQPWYAPVHPFEPLSELAQKNVDLIRSLEN